MPDPYYGGADGFDIVLDICEAACRGLLDHIESELYEAMIPALRDAVERKLGRQVISFSGLSGGDINEAYRADLSDGQRVFVKTHPRAPRTMFGAEARGLGWLREAGALRIPEVLAVSEDDAEGPLFLALEYIELARRRATSTKLWGAGSPRSASVRRVVLWAGPRQLHRLARAGERASPDLARLLPRATARAAATPRDRSGTHRPASAQRFDRLFDRLESLVGPAEPPSRLHGDLWGGNLHIDDRGAPCLIDPAVYGGHREVDLAMMRLFGGFGARVFDAYGEAWPLAPGAESAIPLYQLYPLLVHVNLFGGGYVDTLSRTLEQALRAD